MAASMSDYPVTFDVAYPESPSRWLILVRWLLAIPHLVVLYFLGLIAGLVGSSRSSRFSLPGRTRTASTASWWA